MILITGAARGIGKYLFDEFQEKGHRVFGTYHLTMPDDCWMSNFTRVDVSNYADVENWIGTISGKMSRLTLINCAGINYTSFAHKADVDKWNQVINVNLIGTFNVIRAVLPIMREQGYGRIINFSSVAAQTLVPGASAYAASKAGLWGMTRSIAIENADKGITINNLNLGYFNIGMINEVKLGFQDMLKKKIPTSEFGDPENILKAIEFLIETKYINGTSIDLNGGIF